MRVLSSPLAAIITITVLLILLFLLVRKSRSGFVKLIPIVLIGTVLLSVAGIFIVRLKMSISIICLLLIYIILFFIAIVILSKIVRRLKMRNKNSSQRSQRAQENEYAVPAEITKADVARIVHYCCKSSLLKRFNTRITMDCVWVDVYFKPNWTASVMTACVNDITAMIWQQYGIRAEVNAHH